jgi:hypothetical protein
MSAEVKKQALGKKEEAMRYVDGYVIPTPKKRGTFAC